MPSIAQIGAAVEKSFVMEDWHLIGPDYDRTLMAWFENFDSGWDQLKAKYGERFYRLWKYYLHLLRRILSRPACSTLANRPRLHEDLRLLSTSRLLVAHGGIGL